MTGASTPIAARIERLVHRFLWSSPHPSPRAALSAQFKAYERAVLLVRVFYACALFVTIQSMAEWPALVAVDGMAAPWPSAWIPTDAVPTVIPWVLGAYLVASILVAALPARRATRGLYFVMFVQYVSVISGFGGISHYHHAWVWVSAILVLLPDGGWSERTFVADRRYFLTVVWIAQFLVAFFYMLTGFWKVVFALHGAVTERASTLGFDGFGVMVAFQDLRNGQDPLLSQFFVDHRMIGWALFLGTIYVEVAALGIVFRPRLHRTWGILLIGFHIGTELAMGFTFLPNVLILATLFVCSPFAPDRISVRDALSDLPGVYLARQRRDARQRRVDRARAPVDRHDPRAPEPVTSPVR